MRLLRWFAVAALTRVPLPIDDLHALTRSWTGQYSLGAGDVHFTPEGYDRLAAQVVAALEPLLARQP